MIAIGVLTVVAMHLFEPGRTHAQSAQQGDVRASSFTLVRPDGSVLATLAPGPHGDGKLTLFDATGLPRVKLEGTSALDGAGMALEDADGNPRVQLFYSITNDLAGLRMLAADGQPRLFFSDGRTPGWDEASSAVIYDPDGHPRAGIGMRREDGSYAVTIRDAGGAIVDTLPALP